VVWVFRETNRGKAFVLGIGAPSLIYAMAHTANPAPTQGQVGVFSALVSAAYAQAPGPAPGAGLPHEMPRTMKVEMQGVQTPLRIEALGASREVLFVGNSIDRAVLPGGTQSLSVGVMGGEVQTAQIVPGADQVILRINVQRSFMSDLLDGIGLAGLAASHRSVRIEIVAEPPPVEPPLSAPPMGSDSDAGAPG
jgi:hypothetical protein